MRCVLVLGWSLVHLAHIPTHSDAWTLFPRSSSSSSSTDYDLVIIGAGASGLFAAGAATMLGSKTLLIDQASSIGSRDPNFTTTLQHNIGGDCTNAACVPSKAIRSVARMAVSSKRTIESTDAMLALARSHATKTVFTVRHRDDPQAMVERNPNLDIAIVSDCHFFSPQELSLTVEQWFLSNKSATCWINSTASMTMATTTTSPRIIRSKKFLLATGAAPIIPPKLQESAVAAGVPTYTYQTLLRPSNVEETGKANSIWNWDSADSRSKRIVIVGGGATACELAQSMVRLMGGGQVDLVAPTLLRGEDVSLANAAAQLLSQEGVQLYLRARVEDILQDGSIQLSNHQILAPCDAIIFCTGRSPGPSLERLQLSKANVPWNHTVGVLVRNNLQSISARHVYACGDCCSAVQPLARCATHAAWTGYYAAMQTRIPRLFTRGAKMVHPIVPRVIYTDPELVSVGLSLQDCVAQFGMDGFVRYNVATNQTDRSDMERLDTNNNDNNKYTKEDVGFLELRATKVDGKLLGMTACGPAASELANEMSVVLENGLTAMDIARSLHSYPSYGYILHRVALAIALGNIWGLLDATGTIGKCVAWLGRKLSKLVVFVQNLRRSSALKAWEAEGVSKTWYHPASQSIPSATLSSDKKVRLTTFFDQFHSSESQIGPSGAAPDEKDFHSWVSRRPMHL